MPETVVDSTLSITRPLQSAAALKLARRVVSVSCVAAGALALAALAGWILEIPVLKAGFPNMPEMKANSAVLSLALVFALWLLRSSQPSANVLKPRRRVAFLLCGFVVVVAGMTALQDVLSINFGIDTILFKDTPHDLLPEMRHFFGFDYFGAPGRMSLLAALDYILVALGLLVFDWELRPGIRVSQYLLLLASIPPAFALIAYAYGVQSLIGLGPNALLHSPSLLASLSFFVLCVGGLAARPSVGLVSLVSGNHQAGSLARLLLLSSLLIPPALGFFVVTVSRGKSLEEGVDLAVLVLLLVILIFTYSWWIARGYFRLELSRASALKRMREANESLERRVDERTEELARTAQEVHRSRAFLDTVIENLPIMVFLKDEKDLRFVSVNRAFENLLGFPRELAIGKTDYDIFPKEQADFFTGIDREVLRSKNIRVVPEEPALTKDGRLRILHTTKLGVTSQDGARFLLGVAEDVTERKATQDALVASEERFRTIFENAPLMFVATQPESRYRILNNTFSRLTGYSQDEFNALKDPVTALLPEAAHRAAATDPAIRGDGNFRELRMRKKNGDDAYHLWAVFKLPDSGEISIGIDITDRKQSERELVEARENALDASKAKSSFLATVSHEIRTPINGVIGMTGLLLDTPLAKDQREYAEAIRKSADSLLTIINDILDYSKVEAGKLEFEQLEFSPIVLLGDLHATYSFSAKSKGIELLIDVDADMPRLVRGDPGRLNQVLTNLLSNAIKFTSEGAVRLRARSAPAKPGHCLLRIEVEDSGIGIGPEARAGIFEAFHQADSTMARRFGGTGLGLSISRRLIEMMGGKIGFASELGQGSLFWFEIELPCVKEGDRPGESALLEVLDAPLSEDGRKFRVLVAEDNPVNQKIAVRLLEKLGYRVEAAGNGLEVLEALRTVPYDVIIMDVQMPEMDGFEATRLIRASDNVVWQEVPIIAMTANAMKGDREKCLAAGMSDYLAKPVTRELLGSTVRRWVKVSTSQASD